MSNESLQRAIDIVGGQLALAKALHVTPGAISQWICGRRPLPPFRAAEIETLVKGEVMARELCPDFPWPDTTAKAA